MDYPWRHAGDCHRVVVLLSDEPVETGVGATAQSKKISALIDKLHQKRIKLYIVAPESAILYELSEADRSEYDVIDGVQNGLSNVDFSAMLAAIGKSVSVSQTSVGGSDRATPLFGQHAWVASQGDLGRDNASPHQ